MKLALRYGLYYGIASIVTIFVRYFFFKDWLFDVIPVYTVTMVLPIIFMVLSCLAYRQANEGVMELGEGIRAAWVTYAVGALLSILGTFLLFNIIDPSLKDFAKVKFDTMMENQVDWMNSTVGDDDLVQNEIDKEELKSNSNKMLEMMGDPYRLSFLMMNYFINLLFPGIIFALIIALVLRKKSSGP